MGHFYGRHTFIISDTGTIGDTGPSFWGSIQQIRWVPGTADTGAAFTLSLHPNLRNSPTSDTGHGFNIYSRQFGAQTTEHLRAPVGFSTGADNGGDTGYVPYVAAGDRLRLKIVNQATVTANLDGTLYVWWKG